MRRSRSRNEDVKHEKIHEYYQFDVLLSKPSWNPIQKSRNP